MTVTMDFLREFWPAPDFLKIDVEGAELMVLRGADKILRQDRPVIYIEVNADNREAATDIFKRYNYQLFSIDQSGNETKIEMCQYNTLAKPLENVHK